jgi:hypothetical protein
VLNCAELAGFSVCREKTVRKAEEGTDFKKDYLSSMVQIYTSCGQNGVVNREWRELLAKFAPFAPFAVKK